MANELLTPTEFAAKLKVGRSTLFDWLRQGLLVPGKHYFKVGRVLRFVWDDNTIATLLEATRQPKAPAKQRPITTKPGINWEY